MTVFLYNYNYIYAGWWVAFLWCYTLHHCTQRIYNIWLVFFKLYVQKFIPYNLLQKLWNYTKNCQSFPEKSGTFFRRRSYAVEHVTVVCAVCEVTWPSTTVQVLTLIPSEESARRIYVSLYFTVQDTLAGLHSEGSTFCALS